ncbi:NUDIX domain-containing protein [Cypionkella sinensis]|uniref:ADP-ribose pyrophosphatase n=1 Tax=Cypionkella sinensis TaxID=1756043 RepID=A0ABV7IZU7_9RHOB
MGRETLVLSGSYFFYGPLRDLDLLEQVLGRAVRVTAAWLPDHSVQGDMDAAFPVLLAQSGAQVAGVVLAGVSAAEVARLEFFAAAVAATAQAMTVMQAEGAVDAQVFWRAGAGSGDAWLFEDWQRHFGAELRAMAGDVMALFGVKPAEAVAARRAQMLTRGASRVRAGQAAPTLLRYQAGQGDVAVAALREPYARFFAMEEVDVSFRRFDGSMSPQVTRAGFIACDAVTVLPYDPVRDRVLVVDQFRAGPYLRGDPQPWQIEAIAGRIDAGETPEDAARREAVEEAGLALDDLLPVASYYPSPGCSSEFLYSFVALTDLPDTAAGVFGVEGEAEDIRGHVIGFERLMALVASGEIGNAPTVLSALWLAQNRARLRKA